MKANSGYRNACFGFISTILIGLILLVSVPATSFAADDSARFVGTWELVSWKSKKSDGTTDYPMGESPVGLLIYDARGNISMQIMDDFRSPFTQDYEQVSLTELKSVYETYAAMFGHYTVDSAARTVSIEVQGITNPNYISSTLTRYYELKGDALILAFDPKRMNSTVWKRIK